MTDEIEKRVINLESSVDVIRKDIHRISKEVESLKKTVYSVFTLFKENPEISLMKARKTAEGIAKSLYDHFGCQAKNNGKPSSKIMLDELINVIRKESIPRLIIDNLVNIQNLGNFATHDQGPENETISTESALPAMASLGYVTSWYLQTICGEDFQTPDLSIPVNLSRSLNLRNEPLKNANIPPIGIKKSEVKRSEGSNKNAFQPTQEEYFLNPDIGKRKAFDWRVQQKIREILPKCQFDLKKLIDEFIKNDFRIMSNGRDIVVKFPEKYLYLFEPTLLVVTQEGEVQIVPKWIIPSLEKAIDRSDLVKNIFQDLLNELIPYKFIHPRYSYSLYFKVGGAEDKIANAMTSFMKKLILIEPKSA